VKCDNKLFLLNLHREDLRAKWPHPKHMYFVREKKFTKEIGVPKPTHKYIEKKTVNHSSQFGLIFQTRYLGQETSIIP